MRIPTLLLALLPALAVFGAAHDAMVKSEFIYERAPFPECHASTIIDLNGRLVAAWFGGTHEKHKDVEIWISHHDGKNWSTPVSVANGITGDKRHPTWNPVLFRPDGGPLMLFYKVGPSPSTWWGMRLTSTDGGKTWSQPERLPDDIYGPIKNKPIQLKNGTVISGTSTEHAGWRVHFELSTDGGKNFLRTGSIADPEELGAIQPSVLVHSNGELQALCRTKKGHIGETWSRDGGLSWTPLKPTTLPNPNAGTDALTLKDGRQLLVYNHTPKGRSPLNVAISTDGRTWKQCLALEDSSGEFSYPAVIQANDGMVHITYTWKRQRVKHVVLAPERL